MTEIKGRSESDSKGGLPWKVVVIAVAVLFLAGLFAFSVFSAPKEEFLYVYEVGISPPSGENWTVLVPFPASENDSTEIFNNIQILSGNCSYELNQTEKGLALKITGKGDVHLKSSGTHLKYKYVYLSMSLYNNESTKYWVWHNMEGKNISFVVEWSVRYTHPAPVIPQSQSTDTIDEKAEGVTESGWRLIEGHSYGAIAD